MKWILTLFVVLFFVPAVSGQQYLDRTLEHDGVTREYLVYVPATYTGEEPVPLILNLHGFGSNGNEQLFYGDFRTIADTANFIIVSPTGTLLSGETTHWNVGGWTLASRTDDVGFVDLLLNELESEFSIDETRVYSTGMSNGGYMSFVLACELSERIAAIASVTGSMTPQTFSSCDPQHPMPVMQIHGTDDTVVPYNGDPSWTLSIADVINYWVNFNNCLQFPSEFRLDDTNENDGSVVDRIAYSGGDNDVYTLHYKVSGGGHTWPGALVGEGNVNRDINASKEIWNFFRQYDINGKLELVTSVTGEEIESEIQVFPNPANDHITVEFDYYGSLSFQLFSAQGQLIKRGMVDSGSKINVEALQAGMYFLAIDQKIQKFLKK